MTHPLKVPFLACISICLSTVAMAEDKAALPKEALAALKARDKEVAAAEAQAVSSIRTAQRRYIGKLEEQLKRETAAGNLDGAIAIRDEIQRVKLLLDAKLPSHEESSPLVSREQIMALLTSKTWYSHWESRDRNHPFKYLPDGTRMTPDGNVVKDGRWQLIPQWTIMVDDHVFLILDENTLWGFHIPSRRGVGAFSDPQAPK